jgi:tetratricopeptide (TPR) repeat protein
VFSWSVRHLDDEAARAFRLLGLRPGADFDTYAAAALTDTALQQARWLLDRLAHAAGHLRRSLGLGRETGSRTCQARALAFLGISELRQGRRRQAIGHLRQSLALHSQAGNCSGQAEALNGLGEAFLAASQIGQANAWHAAALAMAIQCGDKCEQARAHSGLASACQVTGDSEQARSHWQALAPYTDLGTPEAEQVRIQIEAAAEGQREPLAQPLPARRPGTHRSASLMP